MSDEFVEVTPTEHYANIVSGAMEATRKIEVREVQVNLVNQIHLLCRVKAENAGEVAQKFVSRLLEASESQDWLDVFCGKQFLRRDGKLVFAWVFSFAGEPIKNVAQFVCDILDEAFPQEKMEVLSAPLMGSGAPQSTGQGVRGAQPLGKGI